MPVTLSPHLGVFGWQSYGPRGQAVEANSLPKASAPWQAPWASAEVALHSFSFCHMARYLGAQRGASFAVFFSFGFLELPE